MLSAQEIQQNAIHLSLSRKVFKMAPLKNEKRCRSVKAHKSLPRICGLPHAKPTQRKSDHFCLIHLDKLGRWITKCLRADQLETAYLFGGGGNDMKFSIKVLSHSASHNYWLPVVKNKGQWSIAVRSWELPQPERKKHHSVPSSSLLSDDSIFQKYNLSLVFLSIFISLALASGFFCLFEHCSEDWCWWNCNFRLVLIFIDRSPSLALPSSRRPLSSAVYFPLRQLSALAGCQAAVAAAVE